MNCVWRQNLQFVSFLISACTGTKPENRKTGSAKPRRRSFLIKQSVFISSDKLEMLEKRMLGINPRSSLGKRTVVKRLLGINPASRRIRPDGFASLKPESNSRIYTKPPWTGRSDGALTGNRCILERTIPAGTVWRVNNFQATRMFRKTRGWPPESNIL